MTQETNKELELVNKDMLIGEIVQLHREAAFVMMQYGLHCIGCAVSSFESLKEGCLAHGMDEETVDKIVDEINAMIKENASREEKEEEQVEEEIQQIKKD